MANDTAADVLFCMMGGTIDSFYDGRIDTVRPHEHSIIPAYIESLKLYASFRFVEIAMKDSRELTDADREKLLQTIESGGERKVIVTHGTYTMPDTARYVLHNLKRRNLRVVLTGSLSPMSSFALSDGTFNLGFAFAAAHALPPDVYVCMNGRIFSANEVVKISEEGVFKSIHDE
jgi:L-asparaginase